MKLRKIGPANLIFCSFLNHNVLEGRLTATLLGQKVDIPVRVQQVSHNVFKAQYTPLTGGTYELHVLWNGKHANGSPFKVSCEVAFNNFLGNC